LLAVWSLMRLSLIVRFIAIGLLGMNLMIHDLENTRLMTLAY
jgi:hypothetical protein